MKTIKEFSTEENRWEAVFHRMQQSDGEFLYGVITTGIYCRPVCSSRRPNRENVQFFDTPQKAEDAGFRPCKRCSPRQKFAPNSTLDVVTQACKIIEESEKEPTLNHRIIFIVFSKKHLGSRLSNMPQRTDKTVCGQICSKTNRLQILFINLDTNLVAASTKMQHLH